MLPKRRIFSDIEWQEFGVPSQDPCQICKAVGDNRKCGPFVVCRKHVLTGGAMTLDQFIEGIPNHAWVAELGFSGLYVRKGPIYVRLNGEYLKRDVLAIANIQARKPGKGFFTKLVERLHPDHNLFVENILDNERFEARLLKMGFVKTDDELPCYYLEGVQCGF